MNQLLTPRLIVSNAAAAITFYEAAFEAKVVERFDDADGKVIHAGLSIRGAHFSVADTNPDWYPPMPPAGVPVLLTLLCDDPDAVCERAVEGGAEVLIPIDDRSYGRREGRIRDPAGHMWILSRVTEELSADEIRRRLAQS